MQQLDGQPFRQRLAIAAQQQADTGGLGAVQGQGAPASNAKGPQQG
jgi:hypothetical protein